MLRIFSSADFAQLGLARTYYSLRLLIFLCIDLVYQDCKVRLTEFCLYVDAMGRDAISLAVEFAFWFWHDDLSRTTHEFRGYSLATKITLGYCRLLFFLIGLAFLSLKLNLLSLTA